MKSMNKVNQSSAQSEYHWFQVGRVVLNISFGNTPRFVDTLKINLSLLRR